MPRYRQIPTGIRSERDIERALVEMGLKGVEVHDPPQPLHDWIGRPTSALATVIVRRKVLGPSSDDVGFARNANGTFDLIVSEIHLFRFDKKWLAELARRTGTEPAAAGPIQFAASLLIPPPKPPTLSSAPSRPSSAPARPPQISSAPAVAARRDSNAIQRAELEAAAVVERAQKSQSMGAIGCLVFFVPVLPSLLVALSSNRKSATGALVVLWVVWSFFYFVGLAVVLATRFQRRVREFTKRFPHGDEERALAIKHLRAIAKDQKNAAAKTAERVLRQVEADVLAAITQRPGKPPGGPAAS